MSANKYKKVADVTFLSGKKFCVASFLKMFVLQRQKHSSYLFSKTVTADNEKLKQKNQYSRRFSQAYFAIPDVLRSHYTSGRKE